MTMGIKATPYTASSPSIGARAFETKDVRDASLVVERAATLPDGDSVSSFRPGRPSSMPERLRTTLQAEHLRYRLQQQTDASLHHARSPLNQRLDPQRVQGGSVRRYEIEGDPVLDATPSTSASALDAGVPTGATDADIAAYVEANANEIGGAYELLYAAAGNSPLGTLSAEHQRVLVDAALDEWIPADGGPIHYSHIHFFASRAEAVEGLGPIVAEAYADRAIELQTEGRSGAPSRTAATLASSAIVAAGDATERRALLERLGDDGAHSLAMALALDDARLHDTELGTPYTGQPLDASSRIVAASDMLAAVRDQAPTAASSAFVDTLFSNIGANGMDSRFSGDLSAQLAGALATQWHPEDPERAAQDAERFATLFATDVGRDLFFGDALSDEAQRVTLQRFRDDPSLYDEVMAAENDRGFVRGLVDGFGSTVSGLGDAASTVWDLVSDSEARTRLVEGVQAFWEAIKDPETREAVLDAAVESFGEDILEAIENFGDDPDYNAGFLISSVIGSAGKLGDLTTFLSETADIARSFRHGNPRAPGASDRTDRGANQVAPGVEHRLILSSYGEAVEAAIRLSGLDARTSIEYRATIGPFEGYVLGRQSPDGLVGWRIDFDGEKGYHINWWDRTGGSNRSDHFYGAITLDGLDEADFLDALAHRFGNSPVDTFPTVE